jgi:voltage-gated sodium channel
VERPPERRNALARLVDSTRFEAVVIAVITANAVVLGLQTYSAIEQEHGDVLDSLNAAFLAFFVVELSLRIASYGRRPHRFFRSGWNVFDFIAVTAAFIPGIRENTTLLRLARLLRVVRVVRLLPEVRILLLAVGRSLPPLFSMTMLTALILYVYGIVGWTLFGEEDPEHWGDIGEAMLTLFVLLTLENFPATLERGMAIEPWSVVYFISFAMVAAFIVLNLLIGVVLNSMEEAREIHVRQELRERGLEPSEEETELLARLGRLRTELTELEAELQHHAARRAGAPTRSAESA